MKETSKLLKLMLRAIPVIPLLARRKLLARSRRRSIAPIVLGAIGVALAGGAAAVMIFMPRTRHRALGIAKDGYGKVRGQLDQISLGSRQKARMSRGAIPKSAVGTGPNYQSAGG